ncbi:hypothetical protein H4219_001677 [Mycoemilia scoparia]|uniref:UBR-type domain-containing protein n=1 Tax=Mycoemilia scoparia TaxID=417184 RepID=A0A9W8A493_9FUNG|nr:hypothetical protein H4219_001677 [Mycoemilia scoparia]
MQLKARARNFVMSITGKSDSANESHQNEEPETKNRAMTAVDYLLQEAELEQKAAQALPGKFDKCTFTKGYIHQPVYACLTCSNDIKNKELAQHSNSIPVGKDGMILAGICYSCSISCHSSHDVIELFSKKNFRCDCGIKILRPESSEGSGMGKCELMDRAKENQSMDTANENNKYNHNFWGYYCRCDTFYDPETEESEMIQCFFCQDWYHDRCIGKMPREESFDSYICRECINRHSILFKHLSKDAVFYGIVDQNTNKVDVIVDATMSINSDVNDPSGTEQNVPMVEHGAQINPPNSKRKLDEMPDESDKDSKKTKAGSAIPNESTHLLPEKLDFSRVDIFMKKAWEECVCKCQGCMEYIKQHNLDYILKDDPVYEPEVDPEKDIPLYDVAMECLDTYDRSMASMGAIALRELGDDLKSFLRPFAAEGKVVTPGDIMSFFDERRRSKTADQ